MADMIQVGFGGSPIAVFTPGVIEVSVRLIQTQPDTMSVLRRVQIATLQTAGVFAGSTYVPLWILRGGGSLGQGSTPGSIAVTNDFRPLSAILPGLPTQDQIRASLELLYASYIRVQSQGVTVDFSEADIVASSGQTLAVITGQMVNGGVVPPALIAGGSSAVMLTALGVSGRARNDQNTFGGGSAQSLPRFGVGSHGFDYGDNG